MVERTLASSSTSKSFVIDFLREALFLVFVLQLVQLPINASLRQQFLVRAALPQLRLVHHQYPVGALNGGQAVRDD